MKKIKKNKDNIILGIAIFFIAVSITLGVVVGITTKNQRDERRIRAVENKFATHQQIQTNQIDHVNKLDKATFEIILDNGDTYLMCDSDNKVVVVRVQEQD